MKEKYLNELNELLKIIYKDDDAITITNDYNELYEDYLASGLKDEEVKKKLGDPKDIIKSLMNEQQSIFYIPKRRNVILPKR